MIVRSQHTEKDDYCNCIHIFLDRVAILLPQLFLDCRFLCDLLGRSRNMLCRMRRARLLPSTGFSVFVISLRGWRTKLNYHYRTISLIESQAMKKQAFLNLSLFFILMVKGFWFQAEVFFFEKFGWRK